MNEIAIGKRVRLVPITSLFKRWTGKTGTIVSREIEDDVIVWCKDASTNEIWWEIVPNTNCDKDDEGNKIPHYRVLLDENRILHSGAESSVMPGEGYLFRRVELESL